MSERRGLVIRLPNWLGDFVDAEPLVRAACAASEPLTLLAPARWLELLEGRFEGVRRIGLEGRESPGDYAGRDRALFLNGSVRSPLCALRAGVPERIAWSGGGRAPFLTHALTPARERGRTPLGLGRPGRFPRRLPRPFGTACAELAAFAGVTVADRAPRFAPGPSALEGAERRLAALGLARTPFLLANVGARPGSAKGYPPELWKRMFEVLDSSGAPPVLACAGPGEEASLTDVGPARALSEPLVDLCEMLALAARAELVLCVDGGVRHLVRAAGGLALVLFGPTDPRHSAEEAQREHWLSVSVPCGPCHRERCPLEGVERHACMRKMDPERVADAALAILG